MRQEDNKYIPRKRLYTVAESATFLGHSIWGVRTLIWSKDLPVVRTGRKQYIDIHDMEAWITKNKK